MYSNASLPTQTTHAHREGHEEWSHTFRDFRKVLSTKILTGERKRQAAMKQSLKIEDSQ